MVFLLEVCFMVYELFFLYIGMDFFGFLYVKYGWGIIKCWCCFFICLIICCVYLEVVNLMDIDDFVMCLRCFINCRGEVKEICCDNGFNFVGV